MRDPDELKTTISGLHIMAADVPDDAKLGVVIVMRHIPKDGAGITRAAWENNISAATAARMLAMALEDITGVPVMPWLAAHVTPEEVEARANVAITEHTFQ